MNNKLNKTWFSNNDTTTFMGLAQDYFVDQGAVFKLEREYKPDEANIHNAMGKDIEGVRETALLSYPNADPNKGRWHVWIRARKTKTGCKISIHEFNQGWDFIEAKWDEFVEHMARNGFPVVDDESLLGNLRSNAVPTTNTKYTIAIDQRSLRIFIQNKYNSDEFRALCFDLGVEYDNLKPSGLEYMIIEFVDLLSRNGRLLELVVFIFQTKGLNASQANAIVI